MFKMIPVQGMNASFLFEQVMQTIELIKAAGGHTVAVICNGNRTNQMPFKKFNTVVGKPWLTIDGVVLLFDFVHLMKRLRNNWLTEKNR